MRIQKALIDGTISTKTAGLLLYSMQLALQSVGKTTFGQVKGQELVRETVDEEQALADMTIGPSENQNRELPLINADDTDREGDLMRTNADGRGLEHGRTPVEWKPTPDMYRKNTPEGREAYEASFQMKITRESQPRAAVHPTKPTPGLPGTAATTHEHTEPLPKGPQFPSELLEASTRDSALQAEPRAVWG
jgi:hypothetical protein